MAWFLPGGRKEGLALASAMACGVLIGRLAASRRDGQPRPRAARALLTAGFLAGDDPRALPWARPAVPLVPPVPDPSWADARQRARRGEEPAARRDPRYARSAAEAAPGAAAPSPRRGARLLARDEAPLWLVSPAWPSR